MGVRCVAVPVFNPLGELIAALSVTGTTTQIPTDGFDRLAATLKEASMRICKAVKVL
jgi:DNA-binding IclR family transcriptional regulator